MPIMDKELTFCEALDIAGVSGTDTTGTYEVYIPQVKNHKGAAIDDSPNNSGRLFWNCVVEDADLLAGTDGSTIKCDLWCHSATGAVDSGSIILTKTITANTPTDHPDGTLLFSLPLPAGQLDQYFEVEFTIGVQTLSTGKVTSWIGGPVQQGE
ncbi:MAG: hypothetical protein WDA41_09710 [Candidatus Neomarinimicrobiota bacterium]